VKPFGKTAPSLYPHGASPYSKKVLDNPSLGHLFGNRSALRTENYRLAHGQPADPSNRAIDSRAVLLRANDRLQHFWRN